MSHSAACQAQPNSPLSELPGAVGIMRVQPRVMSDKAESQAARETVAAYNEAQLGNQHIQVPDGVRSVKQVGHKARTPPSGSRTAP